MFNFIQEQDFYTEKITITSIYCR